MKQKEMSRGLQEARRRWFTARTGTVNRSFLLELERDETAQRGERMKENMKTAAIT